ncbi:MAG: hypothetical protein IPN59_06410 [Holophaga sp.]|nr:hypothetical protein [Holophaga sp.]
MSPLHPPQTPFPAVVFTASGFIRGIFHPPAVKSLRNFLNSSDELLKLTQVVLPGSGQVHPFLALHKSAVLLVVPQGTSELPASEGNQAPRERRLVTCLLSLGSIQGYLETPENIRTSDFLLHNPGFLELTECHIGPNPYLDPKEISGDAIPMVLVNVRCLVGLAEEVDERTAVGTAEVEEH